MLEVVLLHASSTNNVLALVAELITIELPTHAAGKGKISLYLERLIFINRLTVATTIKVQHI